MSLKLQQAIRELEALGESHRLSLEDLYKTEQSLPRREAVYSSAVLAVSVDEGAAAVAQESLERARALFHLGSAYGQMAPETEAGFAEALESLKASGRLPSPEALSGYIAGMAERNPELAQRLAEAVPERLYEGYPHSTLEAVAFGKALEMEYELRVQAGERSFSEAMKAIEALSQKLPEGYAGEASRLVEKEAGKAGPEASQGLRGRDYEVE